MPGYWPNRLKDSWEHCYHFTLNKKFKMYQQTVKVPISIETKLSTQRLSKRSSTRQNSNTKSGFGIDKSKIKGRTEALPSNVIHTLTANTKETFGHSAAFPISLPTFFIKLFSKKGDVVLDPFAGSGTTALAAHATGRQFLCFEKETKG
jgi:site-specific DNA-methyltransferase (adenine-specific)